MQHAQNSTTHSATSTPLDWPPAIWFSTIFGPIEQSDKQSSGQDKSAATPVEGVLKDMAKSATPWVHALTQANTEVASLLTRRAQALSELSTKAIECRQPQDVMALQTQFWASAYQQHTEATKRIVAAWGTVMPMASVLANSIGQSLDAQTSAPTSARAANDMSQEAMSSGDKSAAVPPATLNVQPVTSKIDRRSVA